jgi:septum formation protein
MSNPSLILASASPRRQDLLASLGVVPHAIVPADIDETPHKGERPRHYVLRMAHEKALRVSIEHPDALTLAADTVVACGRRILPKAETHTQARECLARLSGRRHSVFTAFALYVGEHKRSLKCIETMVQFKRLSPQEIDWYIATQEWDGKAGGYAIQGAAQALISQMHGSYSAVVGLPLKEVRDALLTHQCIAAE